MNNRDGQNDIQELARIFILVHQREQCLQRLSMIEKQLRTLRGESDVRLRRTVDRLTLISTLRLDRPDEYPAGVGVSRN